MLKNTIILICALLCLVATAGAQDPSPAVPVAEQPIEISSDRLEGDDAAGVVRFQGSVVARQGKLTIYAEQVTLFYKPGSREFDRVEAFQSVRIVQGNRVATSDKAVYFNQEGRVVLTGSPKVHQGDDFVQGDEITVFLNEEKSIVKSRQGNRVNAIFHPQGAKP